MDGCLLFVGCGNPQNEKVRFNAHSGITFTNFVCEHYLLEHNSTKRNFTHDRHSNYKYDHQYADADKTFPFINGRQQPIHPAGSERS